MTEESTWVSPSAHIQCRALIRRFGGPAQLYRRLVRRGYSISYKTVEKWRDRDAIRADWLAEMLIMARDDGYPVNLLDYIETEQSEEEEEAEAEDGLI